MEKVYFYHRDKGAASRNSVGLLLVRDLKSSFEIIFECPEYSMFFREIVDGTPEREVALKNPDIVPLTLLELCGMGLIELVDGVLGLEGGKAAHVKIK